MFFRLHRSILIFCLGIIASSAISQVSIHTNIPPVIAPGSTLVVEVLINKGNTANFAKYQMDFPAGVTVTEGNSYSGNFTFETGRAKIVWVSLPAESNFKISFNMICGNASGNAVLNHRFYFLENGAKKDFEPEPISIKFDPSGVSSLLPASVAVDNTTAAPVPEQTVAVVPVNTVVPKEPVQETKTVQPVATNTTNSSGLEYKLQLGALGADPGKAKYSAIGEVKIVKEGGFYKVLFGSFSSKEEALKKREELLQKGFSSFVVAYLNGVRQK